MNQKSTDLLAHVYAIIRCSRCGNANSDYTFERLADSAYESGWRLSPGGKYVLCPNCVLPEEDKKETE